MKNKIKTEIKIKFNIKNWSIDRRWTVSIFLAIFILAIVFFILTSWFSIDRAIGNWFGGAMLKTNGDFNKLVRWWATYYDYEPYKAPYVFITVSVFVVLETISKKIIKRYKVNWWKKNDYLLFVVELIIGIIVLYHELRGLYGDYSNANVFGSWFYIWTMSGKDILLSSYVVECIILSSICFSLTWYIHFELANRQDFANGNYWKLAIINSVFFLVINFEYVNGLKFDFNRKYQVNLQFGDWSTKVSSLYPENYKNYINSHENWGSPVGLEPSITGPNMNYPSDYNMAWWKINPKGTGGDAFPSGHMNCVLFFCITLFTLFKNPHTKGQKITSRVMIILATLYLLNMGLILEYSWGHWMSDMSFTLFTVPIMYVLWWLIFNGAVMLSWKFYTYIKDLTINKLRK